MQMMWVVFISKKDTVEETKLIVATLYNNNSSNLLSGEKDWWRAISS